jgi:hypothetical protein
MKSKRNVHGPQQKTRSRRVREWFTRRRRVMVTSLLRGTCYGAGTGFVGLAFWWIENSL